MGRIREIFEQALRSRTDLEPREVQIQMAEKVENALENSQTALIEAGTGVGKSLAYLIPAALYSLEEETIIVISTETKSLQSQLLEKDIPMVAQILETDLRAEMAMGASNYVCKRKMQKTLEDGTFGPEMLPEISKFNRWAASTESGMKQEYDGFASFDFWSRVTREPDNCLGRNCPNFSHSFYFLEKEKWKHANILVINHHLLASHIAGDFKLLPEFKHLIIDEAHNFPDILGKSFRLTITYDELNRLLSLVVSSNKKQGLAIQLEDDDLQALAERAKEDVNLFFNLLLQEVPLRFQSAQRILSPLKLDSGQLKERLESLVYRFEGLLEKYSKDSENQEEKEIAVLLELLATRIGSLAEGLERFYDLDDPSVVVWIEPAGANSVHGFYSICMEPLEPEKLIRDVLAPEMDSIVFTSATLATSGGEMSYFKNKIGQLETKESVFPSPFDFASHCLLYVPQRTLPDPSGDQSQYESVLIQLLPRLIEITDGNAFVLFTSNRALRNCYEALENELGFPIISQLEWGANRAKEMFLETPNSVLFGVSTFWQGVDVKGEKLRNVIITKLPFQVPSEPVLETRIEKAKKKGGNPFMEIQLPHACTVLKQGFGRLIRSAEDTGIVAILDPRIRTKAYGRNLLASLPPAKQVSFLEDLQREYENLPKY